MESVQQGFAFLLKGGPVMWPLFACAIISVAVMIERYFALRKAAADDQALLALVRRHLTEGRMDEALDLCEQAPGPIAAMMASGIRNRHLSADAIERAMEELAMQETPALYKRLGVLDTIITLAPLLGLLGTITGMIRAFHVVASVSGLNAPTAITGGVAEALIATACGLTIAIVTLPGYNYLTERVKEIISQMEIAATQLLNILANLQGA
ncbi:MAG TPA: MotA/TolQ/ExbB proton channel family protein [Armatimonadota bacterium]|nr:MotA/TolQ/ExbB proton channel family protein [Armatimonadota bacterium]